MNRVREKLLQNARPQREPAGPSEVVDFETHLETVPWVAVFHSCVPGPGNHLKA